MGLAVKGQGFQAFRIWWFRGAADLSRLSNLHFLDKATDAKAAHTLDPGQWRMNWKMTWKLGIMETMQDSVLRLLARPNLTYWLLTGNEGKHYISSLNP